jgi:hypothetical protein
MLVAHTRLVDAAIGLRVKSGCAILVLVSIGPKGMPQVAERRTIELCDPAVPHSKQPYHAAMGIAQQDGDAIARLIQIVEDCTERSVAACVAAYRVVPYNLRGAGLVVSSEIDPERIANPHIRAHASEGRLFRQATEKALHAAGVECAIRIERTLYERAAAQLGTTNEQVNRTATGLGRGVAGGWRADDKAAAVAAWMVLSRLC